MSPLGREWRCESLSHLDPEPSELLRCESMPRALAARGEDAVLSGVRREVSGLLGRFPLYEFL